MDGYRDFFDPSKPSLYALWFTIKVTTITTLLSTGIGGALALFMHCRRIPVSGPVRFHRQIPLFAPHLVTAFIFWVLLYPKGYLGIIAQKLLVDYLALVEKAPALVNDPYGFAIILCGTWMRFPYAFLILYGLLQMLDPSSPRRATATRSGRGWRRCCARSTASPTPRSRWTTSTPCPRGPGRTGTSTTARTNRSSSTV